MLWHSKKNHHQILSMQQSFQSGNSINLGDFCSWISCTIIKTNIFSHFAVAHENRRKMARLNKQWRTLQCVNSNVIIILFLTMTHIEKFLLKHSMTTFLSSDFLLNVRVRKNKFYGIKFYDILWVDSCFFFLFHKYISETVDKKIRCNKFSIWNIYISDELIVN